VEGSHEVWARGVIAVVDMAKHAGVPVAALFDGLPFDDAGLRKRRHVAWDHYCEIADRVVAHVGLDRVEELVETTFHLGIPEVRALAGGLVSPKALYRFMLELVNPIMFPMIQVRYDDLGENRVRLDLRLTPGSRPSEPFFRGSLGGIRGMCHHLDLPAAEVVHADIGDDHLVVELELPPSRTLLTRARRRVRAALKVVLGHTADGVPLEVTFGDTSGDAIDPRLDRAIALWHLTPRQAEVLRLVVRGDSNKDIARVLSCAESTVELHVTQLLRRSEAGSRTQLVAQFWTT
jgi:DNA-binding CsgD family transcriptional regulator